MDWQPPDTDQVTPETIRRIIADLANPRADIRLAAVDLISQWYYNDQAVIEATLPSLVPLLYDTDRSVRMSAAHAVGEVGGADHADTLLSAYEHAEGDRGVQLVLVKAMGTVNHPHIIQHLTALHKIADSRCIQVCARKALERIGAAEAREAISVIGETDFSTQRHKETEKK